MAQLSAYTHWWTAGHWTDSLAQLTDIVVSDNFLDSPCIFCEGGHKDLRT